MPIKNLFYINNELVKPIPYKEMYFCGFQICVPIIHQIKGKNNHIYIKTNNKYKKVLLRKGLYVSIKGNNNNNIIFEEPVIFTHTSVVIRGNNNTVIFGKNCNISDTSIQIGNNSSVCIKEKTTIGGAMMYCSEENSSINIGTDCMLSTGIIIMSGDGHKICKKNCNEKINIGKDCIINNHVWVGRNTTICKNVLIPNNCVIGTGAIVTTKFDEENVAIAGNPAKIIKRNITWKR